MLTPAQAERITGFLHKPPPCSEANYAKALEYIGQLASSLRNALAEDEQHNLVLIEHMAQRKGDRGMFETAVATRRANSRLEEILANGKGK